MKIQKYQRLRRKTMKDFSLTSILVVRMQRLKLAAVNVLVSRKCKTKINSILKINSIWMIASNMTGRCNLLSWFM